MFSLTYVCESAFSHMNIIKSNHRASLTQQHLEESLRIALTTYNPDFTKNNMSNLKMSLFALNELFVQSCISI